MSAAYGKLLPALHVASRSRGFRTQVERSAGGEPVSSVMIRPVGQEPQTPSAESLGLGQADWARHACAAEAAAAVGALAIGQVLQVVALRLKQDFRGAEPADP
jgi:hypothetical protein